MAKVMTFKPTSKVAHVSKPTGMKAPHVHYAKPVSFKSVKVPKLPKPKMGTKTRMSKVKI